MLFKSKVLNLIKEIKYLFFIIYNSFIINNSNKVYIRNKIRHFINNKNILILKNKTALIIIIDY